MDPISFPRRLSTHRIVAELALIGKDDMLERCVKH
jgi:hypothetical protein